MSHHHTHEHSHGQSHEQAVQHRFAAPEPVRDTDVDVVVLGGGAAGLAAAKTLGRSRRRVLVLDAGEPRNAPAAGVHNYLAAEGTPPAELVARGRAELAAYDVTVVDASARTVRPEHGAGEEPRFTVVHGDGTETTARRVVVATGASDELPDVAGLRERWGRDVLHCPYCHGWEARGQRVAVLATSPMAAHQAQMWRQLTDSVTVVLQDEAFAPAGREAERLWSRGVLVAHDPAVEVVVEDDRLTGLRLASGEVVTCDAVVVGSVPHPRIDALADLGLVAEPVEMGGAVVAHRLPADPMTGLTAVTGVYAAGNVRDPMATVAASAAAGVQVGAVVNWDLIEAEGEQAAEHSRASVFGREAWEERYADREATMWSGNVNAQLATEAADLAPGRALDIGSGEGGDVLWLASRGWQVPGLEHAEAGIARASHRAEQAGLADRVTWRRLAVQDLTPGEDSFDLVTSHFLHLPDGGMVEVTRLLASLVAPGGTLLVVGHHPDDLTGGPRHGLKEFMFTPEQLLPALEGGPAWADVRAEVRDRTQQWDGQEIAVRDSVLVARRA